MRIAGNLDVEVTWARMDAAARRARGEKAPSPDDPRFALPEPVMRKISAAATLLRVFAQSDDDVLWTPRPVEPSRMARVEWLPTPRLESGPVPETADVWWGEATEVAMRVNHRAFVQTLRVGEYAVPASAVVRDLHELQFCAASAGPWVAKAPHSAAGRLRVRGERGVVDGPIASQAKRLLELYGCLLFEPWFERELDIGVLGPETTSLAPVFASARWFRAPHTLLVDGAGRFVGITTPLHKVEREQFVGLIHVADAAAARLDVVGYGGPFGIDLFRVPTPNGAGRLHVSELNARLTFGRVAHDLAEKVRRRLGISPEDPVTLRFGRGAPPDGTISLLLPGADDDTSAWLEVPPRHAGCV